MAFDFPSSPTIGQTYAPYTWDSEKWVTVFTPPAGLAAPVLALVSMVPEFNLTGDIQLGDLIRYQWDTVTSFDSGALEEATNTIDASEDAALYLLFEADPVAPGTWYFRARIERGATISGWSNTVTLAPVVGDAADYTTTFISSGQM